MKKLIAAALAICLLFALCSCGEEIEEPVARDCGLYITIEAKDVFVVACGTDAGSDSCENADKTPFAPGSTVHFDFAGDAAEASEPCEIAYSVCIYDRNLNVIANESFTDDFSGLAKVKVTVTEDHSILREGEKPSFGGEVIVSFGSFALDHIQLTTEYPIVTMQCTPDVAEKINARIDECQGTIMEEMKYDVDRWDDINYNSWQQHCDNMRDYANHYQDWALKYCQEYFGLSDSDMTAIFGRKTSITE